VRPSALKGRFFIAGVGPASVSFAGEGERLRCERDFEVERHNIDALVAACPTLVRASAEQAESRDPRELDNWVLGRKAY
jgi:hypothetical protein